ncbi:hypothetical protein PR048_026406 [Dryococelus australis]|uniref:Uncharacterized protein n=1 Tax=Dryococelus australis TaxID=614101 RepID=A0ABQ9GL80_9NEOP|nr:hypothetical protein PR048_026406 [Dryococelus australis]
MMQWTTDVNMSIQCAMCWHQFRKVLQSAFTDCCQTGISESNISHILKSSKWHPDKLQLAQKLGKDNPDHNRILQMDSATMSDKSQLCVHPHQQQDQF